jgi:hypothetical protein
MRTAETPAPAAITEMTKAMVAIVDTGITALSPFTFHTSFWLGISTAPLLGALCRFSAKLLKMKRKD